MQIEGSREWSGPRGDWQMTIDDVHARSIDPVPETGRYTVVTPEDRMIGMEFSRVDGNTIRVAITGGRREITFDVTATGQVS